MCLVDLLFCKSCLNILISNLLSLLQCPHGCDSLICHYVIRHICLSKIASMVGKPIHCDGPTTQMTRVSYARVLIEIDLLSDLPSTVTVILPNGNTLVHQLVYESLPCYCKQCKSLGHSTLTCTKGHVPRHRKRPHDTSACSANSSPSAETAAVEKQDQYCAGPSVNL